MLLTDEQIKLITPNHDFLELLRQTIMRLQENINSIEKNDTENDLSKEALALEDATKTTIV